MPVEILTRAARNAKLSPPEQVLAPVDKCLRKNRAVTVTSDPALEVGRKLHPELKKLWDELTAVAQLHNERVADQLTGNAENTVDRLRALNDQKFDSSHERRGAA